MLGKIIKILNNDYFYAFSKKMIVIDKMEVVLQEFNTLKLDLCVRKNGLITKHLLKFTSFGFRH